MAATKLSFLSRQFSRPLEQQPASQQLQPTQPVASTSGAQPAAGNEFRSHTCVPYDWALKRYMRFISPQRFTVYEESTRMSMRQGGWAQDCGGALAMSRERAREEGVGDGMLGVLPCP